MRVLELEPHAAVIRSDLLHELATEMLVAGFDDEELVRAAGSLDDTNAARMHFAAAIKRLRSESAEAWLDNHLGRWSPFDEGRTRGSAGSEGGTILEDLECSAGARITLERIAGPPARAAITCGIYGNLVHTFYEGERAAQAMFDALRAELGPLALRGTQRGMDGFINRWRG